jgi:RimJ/RimL family protein N-acetyltransferase
VVCAVLPEKLMIATLRKLQPADRPKVRAMYATFEPKGRFQGLPPTTAELINDWLRRLERARSAEFVVDVEGGVVGHSMLCPGPKSAEAEFAIFIHQDFRGLGLGKALTRGTLNHGCKILELDRVWLSVQGANPCALHLFESVGFRPVGKHDPLSWEMEMERPSHCAECLGERCQIFGEALPRDVSFRRPKVTLCRD